MSVDSTSAPVWATIMERGAKPRGANWDTTCPAHKDDTKSLSVSIGISGKVLFKCFAGCKVEDIVNGYGHEMKDTFPVDDKSMAAPSPHAKIVATYDYVDEQGEVLYQVVRTEPKGFRQRRIVDGRNVWKLGDVRRVVYRLPEIKAAPSRPVFIVEGEKDADNLARLGFLSTTVCSGAGGWRASYAEQIGLDRIVICLPDNDEPGRQFAVQAATFFEGALVVGLPVAEKGDVSDWIASGGTGAQLRAMVLQAARRRLDVAAKILKKLGGAG